MFVASAPVARALPPAAAGALASSNVEWVAAVPDLAPVGARFIGDIMYVTTAQGLRIFDVSGGIPVPLGALELPHYENEDVDTNGKILLIAADHAAGSPNLLYVIDVRDPRLPVLLSVARVSAAHTASCIADCSFAWMGGAAGGRVYVEDLRNPAAPKESSFTVPAVSKAPSSLVHDVQVDAAGLAWVSTGRGLFSYRTDDPIRPVLDAASLTPGDGLHNNFIIHNSLRPWATTAAPNGDARNDIVLVTEENWLTIDNGRCANDGRFQTARYTVDAAGRRLVRQLADFHVGQGTLPDAKPTAVQSCSSHYFSARDDGVVAVAWYEQGTRFLAVDPATGSIRQIGYYMPLVGETFAAYFHGGYVYTLDTYRGLEVLRFTGTPASARALAPAVRASRIARPDPTWGFACRVVV